MRVVQVPEQQCECSERNSEWNGTPQSRAVIGFAAERLAEQTRNVPLSVPPPFLRVEQWNTAERSEAGR